MRKKGPKIGRKGQQRGAAAVAAGDGNAVCFRYRTIEARCNARDDCTKADAI